MVIITDMNTDGSDNVYSDKPSSNSKRKKLIIFGVALALVGAVVAAVWLLVISPRPMADNQANETYMQVQSQIYNQRSQNDEGSLKQIEADSVTIERADGSTKSYRLSQQAYYLLGPDADEVTIDELSVDADVGLVYYDGTNQIEYIWQYEE